MSSWAARVVELELVEGLVVGSVVVVVVEDRVVVELELLDVGLVVVVALPSGAQVSSAPAQSPWSCVIASALSVTLRVSFCASATGTETKRALSLPRIVELLNCRSPSTHTSKVTEPQFCSVSSTPIQDRNSP